MNKLYLGAAYYPELWEEEEIEKDIARIKEAGLNCVRVAEFAWGKMEPKEGDFQFGWLKNIVEKLYENGIYTVPYFVRPRQRRPDGSLQNILKRAW